MTVKGHLEGLITETIQSHILPLSPLKAMKESLTGCSFGFAVTMLLPLKQKWLPWKSQ